MLPCNLCDKILSGNLNRHKKLIHDDIKDFQCSTCAKTFPLKWQLIQHENAQIQQKLWVIQM